MNEDRRLMVARVSAEMFVSADLNDVCRWLIDCMRNPVCLDADHLPALGQRSWLRVATPITAPRAVLCKLWLVEEVDSAGCLLAGHLSFVAHPTAFGVRATFDGRQAFAPRQEEPRGHRDTAIRQLLEEIASAIERPRTMAIPGIAS